MKTAIHSSIDAILEKKLPTAIATLQKLVQTSGYRGEENAIQEWRDLMGATDPSKANEGTVRKVFGTSIGNNATHGSDAPQTAAQELGMFFPEFFEEQK